VVVHEFRMFLLQRNEFAVQAVVFVVVNDRSVKNVVPIVVLAQLFKECAISISWFQGLS
jgi:hypothetical protein